MIHLDSNAVGSASNGASHTVAGQPFSIMYRRTDPSIPFEGETSIKTWNLNKMQLTANSPFKLASLLLRLGLWEIADSLSTAVLLNYSLY